jgi:hypothetical protein
MSSQGQNLGARRTRVTQPHRRFGAEELAALPREDRRKLAQVLLTDTGARGLEFQAVAAYDELVLETQMLWRARRVRVRVADQPVDQDAVDRLGAAVRAAGDAEGVLIAAVGVTAAPSVPAEIMLVDPASFIARMERCAAIAWPDRHPTPAYDRVAAQRALDRDAYLLDPVGLRWLPSLALHELPSDLAGRELPAEDLFEQVAFRLLTSSLRFSGERFGESRRGERLPDAVLRWPGSQRLAALLDCKATSSGYTMDADHFLRFAHYVERLREGVERDGHELRYMLTLSSSFPGTPGARHPFVARAKALSEQTGLQLVYLRAEDLARAATYIESSGMSPAERDGLGWGEAFDHGIVLAEHLDAVVGV